jgi:hypothetical protein
MINSDGSVNATPAASDSPAEPVVWAMLFSRIVPRSLSQRNSVIERTATGIDADTVRPILRPRYVDDAAKTMPSTAPITTAGMVSSGMSCRLGRTVCAR